MSGPDLRRQAQYIEALRRDPISDAARRELSTTLATLVKGNRVGRTQRYE